MLIRPGSRYNVITTGLHQENYDLLKNISTRAFDKMIKCVHSYMNKHSKMQSSWVLDAYRLEFKEITHLFEQDYDSGSKVLGIVVWEAAKIHVDKWSFCKVSRIHRNPSYDVLHYFKLKFF